MLRPSLDSYCSFLPPPPAHAFLDALASLDFTLVSE